MKVSGYDYIWLFPPIFDRLLMTDTLGDGGTSSRLRGFPVNMFLELLRLGCWFSGLARTDCTNWSMSCFRFSRSCLASWLLLSNSAVFMVISNNPLFANISAVLSNLALFSGTCNYKKKNCDLLMKNISWTYKFCGIVMFVFLLESEALSWSGDEVIRSVEWTQLIKVQVHDNYLQKHIKV